MFIPLYKTFRHLQLKISDGRLGLSRIASDRVRSGRVGSDRVGPGRGGSGQVRSGRSGAPQIIAICSRPLAAAAAILEQARAVVLMLHMCVSGGGSNRKAGRIQ